MPSRYRNLLISLGTDDIDHHGRSLTDHLIGTSKLLEKWGNANEIVVAGAFHSIYGTEEFKSQAISLKRRSEIFELIGSKAEHLVYLFCVANRRNFYLVGDNDAPFITVPGEGGRKVPLSLEQYKALLELEAANIVDQALHQTGVPESVVKFWLESFNSKRNYLSNGAAAETEATLSKAMERTPHNSPLNIDSQAS